MVVIRLDMFRYITTKPFEYFNSYLNHFNGVVLLRKLKALRLRIKEDESTLKAQINVFLRRNGSIHIFQFQYCEYALYKAHHVDSATKSARIKNLKRFNVFNAIRVF
jgi:hypothetical protein